MPVDRSLAEGLAENLAQLYRDAETRLAANLAARIRSDITSSAEDRLLALAELRRQAETILAGLKGPRAREIERGLIAAYARGAAAAVDEIAGLSGDSLGDWLAQRSRIVRAIRWMLGYSKRRDARVQTAVNRVRSALPGVDSIMVLAQNLTRDSDTAHLQVLRWQRDAYREVMAQPVADALAGLKTRLRSAQVAWERLLSRGVTGFTDKAGRRWELASYTEMATRTTLAHAAIEGHLDRLRQTGTDLVIVSDAPEECKRCRPFEGQVLSIDGTAGPRVEEHAIEDGRTLTIDVVATVAGAVAAGLMHPNCRHRLAMYLPGVTKVPTHTADPQGDKDRQTLRRLERELRALKLKRDALIDPDEKTALGRKIRAKQARIRDHVAATSTQRQPHREQIDDRLPLAPIPPTPRPEREKTQPKLDGLAGLKQRETEREAAVPERTPDLPEPEAPAGPRGIVPADAMEAIDRKREFHADIQAVFEGRTFGGLHVVVDPDDITVDGGRISFTGEVRNADGFMVGTIERSVSRDKDGVLYANHRLLNINADLRGQGFSQEVNEALFDWYRAGDVAYVKLFADIDVGGYAWARAGYDWASEDDAEGVFDRVWGVLDDEPDEAAKDAARALLDRAEDAAFGSEDYPSPYEVSQLGRQEGDIGRDALWLGKRAMLGARWYGVKEV
jgi:hypothetical protein